MMPLRLAVRLGRASVLALAVLAPRAGSAEDPAAPPADSKNPQVVIQTSMGEILVELLAREAPVTVSTFLDLAEGRREWTDPKSGAAKKVPFYDGLIFHRVIDRFMIQGGDPLGTGSGGPGFSFDDEINAESLGLDKEKAFTGGQPHVAVPIRSQAEFEAKILKPLSEDMGLSTNEEIQAHRKEIEARIASLSVKEALEMLGYRFCPDLRSSPPVRGVLAMANSGPNTNGSQFFIKVVDTPHLIGKHTVFGRVVQGMEVVDAISKVKTGAQGRPLKPVTIVSIRQPESAEPGK